MALFLNQSVQKVCLADPRRNVIIVNYVDVRLYNDVVKKQFKVH